MSLVLPGFCDRPGRPAGKAPPADALVDSDTKCKGDGPG